MAVAPVNGMTPIAIVMPVPMVAPVDRFDGALSALQRQQAGRGSSLHCWRRREHEHGDSEDRKKLQHEDFPLLNLSDSVFLLE